MHAFMSKQAKNFKLRFITYVTDIVLTHASTGSSAYFSRILTNLHLNLIYDGQNYEYSHTFSRSFASFWLFSH